jgi:hypothetical protein
MTVKGRSSRQSPWFSVEDAHSDNALLVGDSLERRRVRQEPRVLTSGHTSKHERFVSRRRPSPPPTGETTASARVNADLLLRAVVVVVEFRFSFFSCVCLALFYRRTTLTPRPACILDDEEQTNKKRSFSRNTFHASSTHFPRSSLPRCASHPRLVRCSPTEMPIVFDTTRRHCSTPIDLHDARSLRLVGRFGR